MSHIQTSINLRRLLLPPLLVVSLVAVTLAVLATVDGRASANHNSTACDDNIPAGYTCVPLVNKPNSGPGITTPAIGELFYLWVGTDTMRIAIRDIPVPTSDTVDNGADHQFCMDDDNEPYSEGTIGANPPPHCTGGNAAGTNVTDGTTGIPAAGAGEEDDSAAGLDGKYEVRVTGMVSDGTVDSIPYYQFNDMTGYTFFVYHVNIGSASTQAFWTSSTLPSITPPVTTTAPATTAPATTAPATTAPATTAPATTAPATTAPATTAPATTAPATTAPATTAPATTAPATTAPATTAPATTAPATTAPVITAPATTAPATVTPTPTATAPPTDPPSPSPTALPATQTPAPTDSPTPTALPASATPGGLPPTGGDAAGGSASTTWLLVLLASAFLLLAGGVSLAAARAPRD